VAEADCDCRPPRVRSTASESRAQIDSAASAILHSSPDPSSLRLQPCQTLRCWHSTSAHSARMAAVQPDCIGAEFRTGDKAAQRASLSVVHQTFGT